MFIDPWGLAYRVSSNDLIAVDTGCGIYLGLPIEEFVPVITYNPYGGPIGESWEPKILWFNHLISYDKMSQGKYDAVKRMLEGKIDTSNQLERLDGLVTTAEFACNTVPFFDAAYKACYEKDLSGAAKSAAFEGGIYLISYGTVKIFNCALNKCAKLGTVVDDVAKQIPNKGIYEFPDLKAANKPYVGQSGNIPNRLQQHKQAGRLAPDVTPQVTPVQGGKTAREIAEHKRIQEITGGVPASKSNAVSNKRDPIGPNRKYLIE